jgi:hypothetical protein
VRPSAPSRNVLGLLLVQPTPPDVSLAPRRRPCRRGISCSCRLGKSGAMADVWRLLGGFGVLVVVRDAVQEQ